MPIGPIPPRPRYVEVKRRETGISIGSKNKTMGDFDLRPAFILVAIIAAIGGWAIIEGIIWLVKHVSIHVG